MANEESVKKLILSTLFENSSQINLPVDGGMYINNTRTGLQNQPYKHLEDKKSPLTADDYVTNQSLSLSLSVNGRQIADKDFCPQNKNELSISIVKLLDAIGNNDLSKKNISKIWKFIVKNVSNED